MPTYKLMYFNAPGLAEVARMLFSLKEPEVEYEDYRFKDGEWPTIKGDRTQFPVGQAPVLMIDGQPIPGSGAIYRHLAREFGYYGKNNTEALQIDVICEIVVDIRTKFSAAFFEKDEAKKAELRKEFKENTSKPFFTFLQDSIRKSGGKYFVGKSVTLADLVVFSLLDILTNGLMKIEGLIEQYPDLMKFRKGIQEDSPLKSYLELPPATDN